MPDEVKRAVGFALREVQNGKTPLNAKALSGFGGGSVLEIKENHNKQTFRAIYTVEFEDVIYVLHAFQKKSKSGKATPQRDIELIKSRLSDAKQAHQESSDEEEI